MESAVFIVATVAFIAGALGIAYEGAARTPSARARTGLYVFAAVAAALAYAVMANGAGSVISDGGPFRAPRFILWTVVAPALFVALALSAFPSGQRNLGLTVALGLASCATFVALGISALTAGLTQWVWFAVSVALLLGALAIVWLPLREYAEDGHPVRREVFTALAGATTVLWALVPLVFLFGPNGFRVWGEATSTTLYALADVGLIVGTGLLAVWSGRHLLAVEPAERGESAAGAPARAFRPVTRPLRRPATAPGTGGARAASADGPSARTEAAARIREEWALARERLLARGQWRSIRSRTPRAASPRPPSRPGLPRSPLAGLGSPPRRLVLRGAVYELAGQVGGTGGATEPARGRPLRPGAEPPREVAIGGWRYRRTEAGSRDGADAARPRGPRFPWRAGAPGATRGAQGETPQPRPAPEARHRPMPRPARMPRRAAERRDGFSLPTSIANLPLNRIPPESAVPVVIVAGVLYWVARPRRPERPG